MFLVLPAKCHIMEDKKSTTSTHNRLLYLGVIVFYYDLKLILPEKNLEPHYHVLKTGYLCYKQRHLCDKILFRSFKRSWKVGWMWGVEKYFTLLQLSFLEIGEDACDRKKSEKFYEGPGWNVKQCIITRICNCRN